MCAKWTHKTEALSWLVWPAMIIVGMIVASVMPFAVEHPVAFKVLLVAVPVGFVVWVVVLAVMKKQ